MKTGEARALVYRDWMGRQYIAAEGISYDFLITLYDVNSPRAWAARFFNAKEMEKALKAGLGVGDDREAEPEARIMGLQNGEGSRLPPRAARVPV